MAKFQLFIFGHFSFEVPVDRIPTGKLPQNPYPREFRRSQARGSPAVCSDFPTSVAQLVRPTVGSSCSTGTTPSGNLRAHHHTVVSRGGKWVCGVPNPGMVYTFVFRRLTYENVDVPIASLNPSPPRLPFTPFSTALMDQAVFSPWFHHQNKVQGFTHTLCWAPCFVAW